MPPDSMMAGILLEVEEPRAGQAQPVEAHSRSWEQQACIYRCSPAEIFQRL